MKRLVEKTIPNNPKKYNYFVYLWEVVEKNKYYIGYHKGTPNDGYQESSKNVDLRRDFINPKNTLKYTILGFFKTKLEAEEYEGKEIRTRESKGDTLYNIGKGRKMVWDQEKIEKKYNEIQELIQNGEYKTRNKIELENLIDKNWYQVRKNEDNKHIGNIVTRINDLRGSIEDTDPIIVGVTDEWRRGISGYHTGKSILKSKALEFKLIETDLSDFNRLEIIKLSSMFNDTDKEKKNQDIEDYVKQVVELYEEKGYEPDSIHVLEWLEPIKWLDSKRTNTVIRRATEIVETKKVEEESGMKWKKYTDSEKKKVVKEKQKLYKVKDGVEVMGSGKFPFNNLHKKYWDHSKGCWRTDIKNVWIYIHHTSQKKKDQWDNVGGKSFELMMKTLTNIKEEGKGIPFRVHVHVLEHLVPDTQ